VCSSDLDTGAYIYDCHGFHRIACLPIDQVPKNKDNTNDPTRCEYIWGIEGLQGTSLVAVGGSDGTIAVCDFSLSRKKLCVEQGLFGHRRAVTSLASSVTHLVSGDESGQVSIWNNGSFDQLCQFPSMGQPCTSTVIQGDFVAASYASGVVRVYNVTLSRVIAEIDAHCRMLNAMDIHLQHNVFATAGEDGFVNVWRLPRKHQTDFELVSSHHFKDSLLVGVAFAKEAGNKYFVTAYDEKQLTVLS
jgi:WD40 repeat protein